MHPYEYPVNAAMTLVNTQISDEAPYRACGNRKRDDPWSGSFQHCKRRRLDPSEFLVGDDHQSGNGRVVNNKQSTSNVLTLSRKRPASDSPQHWSPKQFSWMMNNLPTHQVTPQALSTSRAMVVWKPPCTTTKVSIGRLPPPATSDEDSGNEDDVVLLLDDAESTDDDVMDTSCNL